jgi:hypothetical protein
LLIEQNIYRQRKNVHFFLLLDEAITDKNDEYKVSEVEKKLIRRYEKVFRKIKKNISLFPTNKAIDNKNNLIYKTNLNISDQALNLSKRSGKNLDRGTVL